MNVAMKEIIKMAFAVSFSTMNFRQRHSLALSSIFFSQDFDRLIGTNLSEVPFLLFFNMQKWPR